VNYIFAFIKFKKTPAGYSQFIAHVIFEAPPSPSSRANLATKNGKGCRR